MTALIAFVALCLLVVGVGSVVRYLLPEQREIRAGNRRGRKSLAVKTRQLGVARAALIKIAANDSGNPSLDANIALEDIQREEIKELESND